MAKVKVDPKVKERRPGLARDAEMVAMHLTQERARALAEELLVEIEESRDGRRLTAEIEDTAKVPRAKPVHDRSSMKPLVHTAAEVAAQAATETDPHAIFRTLAQAMVRSMVEMLHLGKYKVALPLQHRAAPVVLGGAKNVLHHAGAAVEVIAGRVRMTVPTTEDPGSLGNLPASVRSLAKAAVNRARIVLNQIADRTHLAGAPEIRPKPRVTPSPGPAPGSGA